MLRGFGTPELETTGQKWKSPPVKSQTGNVTTGGERLQSIGQTIGNFQCLYLA